MIEINYDIFILIIYPVYMIYWIYLYIMYLDTHKWYKNISGYICISCITIYLLYIYVYIYIFRSSLQLHFHYGEEIRVVCTLRKPYSHFLSNWMGYDRGNSFHFEFQPNGIQFGSKSKIKLSPRSYSNHCESIQKFVFLNVVNRLFVNRE